MSFPSILLIEDDDNIREILALTLESEGYKVQSTSNGAEALDYLKTHAHPGLILLDWIMPLMNGAEFVKIQDSDSRLRKIPTLIISATTPELHQRFPAVQDCFLKPFSVSSLLERIRFFQLPEGMLAN